VGGEEGGRAIDPGGADPASREQAQGLVEDPVVAAVAVAVVRPRGSGRDRTRDGDQQGDRGGSEAAHGGTGSGHGILGGEGLDPHDAPLAERSSLRRWSYAAPR